MTVVNDPIEDGVGDRGFADHVVPLRDGQLGGDESGFSPVALLEDFQEIETLLIVEAVGAPIVEHQQLNTGEFVDEAREAAIEACQGEIFEQTRHA